MVQSVGRSKFWIKLFIAFIFVGGFAGFFIAGGDQWLTLETLKTQRDWLLSYTQDHYLVSLLVCILIYTSAIALSIPGAIILSLTTGFICGRWAGTLIIIFSATLGGTIVFLAVRYLFAEVVQRRVGGVIKRLIAGFSKDAFHYLLFLRLVPVFPFWLINLAAPLAGVRLRTYIIATALGIIPGSFVFANLGESLGRIDSLGQLLSWQMASAFILLGLFALIPIIIKKSRAKKLLNKSLENSI